MTLTEVLDFPSSFFDKGNQGFFKFLGVFVIGRGEYGVESFRSCRWAGDV